MNKPAENICEIVAVRHGQTEANRTGILQGQLDVALDELGIRQAEAAAERLKAWQFDAVFSSDLSRAMKTAQSIVKFHPHLNITPTSALREWNLGDLQGKKLEYLRRTQPDLMKIFRDEVDRSIPNGESAQEFQTRVTDFITQTARQNSARRILLVTHGGVIQRIFRCVAGAIASGNFKPFCANTSLSIFRYRDGENWQLVTWNDTAHLEKLTQNDLAVY